MKTVTPDDIAQAWRYWYRDGFKRPSEAVHALCFPQPDPRPEPESGSPRTYMCTFEYPDGELRFWGDLDFSSAMAVASRHNIVKIYVGYNRIGPLMIRKEKSKSARESLPGSNWALDMGPNPSTTNHAIVYDDKARIRFLYDGPVVDHARTTTAQLRRVLWQNKMRLVGQFIDEFTTNEDRPLVAKVSNRIGKLREMEVSLFERNN